MKRVFISYARTASEQPLAKWIASALRKARDVEDVFLDEESLPAGAPLSASIARSIRESHAVVFLISQSWMDRDYTTQELDDVARADGTGEVIRRVAVFRQPRNSFPVLPAQLSRFVQPIEWIDGQTDPHTALWEIYCGIFNIPPGAQSERHQKGVSLGREAGNPPESSKPIADHPSLECGREREWADVSIDPVNRYRLLVIGGPKQESHDHFVIRMERFLTHTPPRSIVHVHWTTGTGAEVRPQHKDDYLECFGRALTHDGRIPSQEALAALLSAKLAEENLIAIHPRIDSLFEDDQLIDYYRKWLPELLDKAKPRMRLRCVQPVAWSSSHGIAALLRACRIRNWSVPSVLDWMCSQEERLARCMVRSLRGKPKQKMLLPVELSPIALLDVDTFCDRRGYSEEVQSEIRQRIARARTSEELLAALDRYLIAMERAEAERRAA